MSLTSWKKEFYPVAADSKAARKDPIAHSLRKWEGVRKVNLAKHGVTIEHGAVVTDHGSARVDFSSETCALCQVFYDHWAATNSQCEKCPLAQVLGGSCVGEERAPYKVFIGEEDPRPMIRALKKAAKLATAKAPK